MKTPRIILWDELPDVIKQELSAPWEESPLAAGGYQSEAGTGSAPFKAFGSSRDQAPWRN
jgi:hypothetical protein